MIDSYVYFYQNIKEKEKDKKIKLNLSFLIKFSNEYIIEQEIIEMIETGFIPYINLRISNNIEPYILMDINLNEIGSLYNHRINAIKPEINEFSYLDEPNKDCIKIHSVLICLMNIKKLKDLTIDKNGLNIKVNIDFLFNFCQVLGIIKRNYKKFLGQIISKYKKEKIKCEYEEVYDSFLLQVQKLSNEKDGNIFDNMSLLIEKIILKLQQELYKLKYNEEFNYDSSKLLLENIKINDKQTLIQKLFFFKIEITEDCNCKKAKYYQLKYYLEFCLNEKDGDSIEIISLFKQLETKGKCNSCGKELIQKRTLISLPEYLIIVVNDKNTKKTITTYLQKKIDIKQFCSNIQDKKVEFELVSFTNEKFYFLIKSKKDEWICNLTEIRNISHTQKVPNLLIYKRIKKK